MPSILWKPIAWNSACAPLPISAMTLLSLRAIQRAASTDIAAVRSAVVTVSSESSSGYPVCTSASTPNAVTVSRPSAVFFGCPFTYLNV